MGRIKQADPASKHPKELAKSTTRRIPNFLCSQCKGPLDYEKIIAFSKPVDSKEDNHLLISEMTHVSQYAFLLKQRLPTLIAAPIKTTLSPVIIVLGYEF